MATLSMVSASSFLCYNNPATCSLALSAGSKRSFTSLTAASGKFTRSGLLHCTFIPSSSLSISSRSSFSGSSLGLDFSSNRELGNGRVRRFVVRAGKPALCLTKRNRSRKSLARTHGFRRRMRTTSGRAVLKRRRAKGRKILCTKSYPSSGKAS